MSGTRRTKKGKSRESESWDVDIDKLALITTSNAALRWAISAGLLSPLGPPIAAYIRRAIEYLIKKGERRKENKIHERHFSQCIAIQKITIV